jgi:D-arabinose 1-dehydrogenase-like Zn-dependent alcohol dehydrogenase
MCAGKTVFTPMLQYGIKKGDRVGIVGIGGLGHLAIQFAAKLGATVVVISSTDSKREEAMKLGASEFHLVKDLKQVKGIDSLFVTANKHLEWQP